MATPKTRRTGAVDRGLAEAADRLERGDYRGGRLNVSGVGAIVLCATCAHYVENGKVPSTGMEIGNCRRNAPTGSGWPQVYALDFCGQHRLATK